MSLYRILYFCTDGTGDTSYDMTWDNIIKTAKEWIKQDDGFTEPCRDAFINFLDNLPDGSTMHVIIDDLDFKIEKAG